MNSKQLEFFLTTLRTKSIAAAARQLDVTQPAVSQQLTKLEKSLGVSLLTRDYKGVSPTQSGEVFAKHAKNILAELSQAKAEIRELVTAQRTEIKIGMMPSICNVLSIPLVDEIDKLNTAITVDISTGPSYSLSGWLENGTIDLALTYEQAFSSDYMLATPLIEEFMYAVFSQRYEQYQDSEILRHTEIPFWALSEFKILIPGEKDALGKFIDKCERDTGIKLHHDSSYTGNLMTGLRQVTTGKSLAILPSAAFHHLEDRGEVRSIKIVQPELRRRVLAITHKNKPRSNKVNEIIELIQRIAQSLNRIDVWRGELC